MNTLHFSTSVESSKLGRIFLISLWIESLSNTRTLKKVLPVSSVAVQAFSGATLQIVANPCCELEFCYSSQHNVSDPPLQGLSLLD